MLGFLMILSRNVDVLYRSQSLVLGENLAENKNNSQRP